MSSQTALFPLGKTAITPAALSALRNAGKNPATFLDRHVVGDWGDISEGDAAENVLALKEGYRLWSSYHVGDEEKLVIITEADRSSTTILLRSEY